MSTNTNDTRIIFYQSKWPERIAGFLSLYCRYLFSDRRNASINLRLSFFPNSLIDTTLVKNCYRINYRFIGDLNINHTHYFYYYHVTEQMARKNFTSFLILCISANYSPNWRSFKLEHQLWSSFVNFVERLKKKSLKDLVDRCMRNMIFLFSNIILIARSYFETRNSILNRR